MNFLDQLLTTAKPYSLELLAQAKTHSQTLRAFVARHPKHVTAVVAAVLLGGGGGAFAVANLGPDAANLPVRTLVETLETPNLEAQVAALEQKTLRLYRNDITRGSDTPEGLLRRLGFITRGANNKFSVRTDTAPLTASVRMSGGTVASSLYAASDEARLPDTVTRQLADVFSGQIDFHRALRKGAVFSVVYETLEAEGEPLRTGRLLSAEITNDKKTYDAVWFQEPGQKGAYYTMSGDSLRRAFLASPVPYSRRTSGFGMRQHPILHTQRAHTGVDYAAPTGTPVMTVADGVVVESSYQGAYGNMVVVQHNARQSTVYAHLSRMQVKRGQTIKQGDIIGAVGTTGLSTGPHLHFEFRIGGRHVDPLTLAQQGSAEPISSALRPQFNQRAQVARSQLMAAAQMRQGNIQ